jgi:hypothetical protein
MIEPSLSTMLGGLEDLRGRVEKESFRDLVPFSYTLLFGSFCQKLILFSSPKDSLFIFNDIQELKFEKGRTLEEKYI